MTDFTIQETETKEVLETVEQEFVECDCCDQSVQVDNVVTLRYRIPFPEEADAPHSEFRGTLCYRCAGMDIPPTDFVESRSDRTEGVMQRLPSVRDCLMTKGNLYLRDSVFYLGSILFVSLILISAWILVIDWV
jgi:hypothetical protein